MDTVPVEGIEYNERYHVADVESCVARSAWINVPFKYLNRTFDNGGFAYGDQYLLLSVKLYTKVPLADVPLFVIVIGYCCVRESPPISTMKVELYDGYNGLEYSYEIE